MKNSELNRIIREEVKNVMRQEAENRVSGLPQDIRAAFQAMGYTEEELKSLTRLVIAGGGGPASPNMGDLKVASKVLYGILFTPLVRNALKAASTKS